MNTRHVAFRLVLIGVPIAILVAVETATRVSFHHRHGCSYGQALAYLPHATLIFRVNGQHYSWRGRTHRLAVLQPPSFFDRTDGNDRIWILGGSTSEPTPTGTEWSETLKSKLRRTTIVNMAHSAYGTAQMLQLYRAYHRHIKPSVIIIFSGWNGRGAGSSPYSWRPPNTATSFDGPAQHLSAQLMNHSAFYGRLWHWVHETQSPTCQVVVPPDAELMAWEAAEERFVQEVAATYRTYVVLMPSLVMRDDAASALPDRLACVQLSWSSHATRYNQILGVTRRISDRLQVPLLDATTAYHALPTDTHVSFFLDIAHQTPAGNAFLGRAIANALKSDGWGATLEWREDPLN